MPSKRRTDPLFLDDVKTILGDPAGILRKPPTRAELEEQRQLCGLLWGYADAGDAEWGPDSDRAGLLHTAAGETIEVRYINWGGQILDLFPVPKRVPRCRIWFLRHPNGTEYLIAMTNVTEIAEGHFPDLNGIVSPRVAALLPGSYIEQVS